MGRAPHVLGALGLPDAVRSACSGSSTGVVTAIRLLATGHSMLRVLVGLVDEKFLIGVAGDRSRRSFRSLMSRLRDRLQRHGVLPTNETLLHVIGGRRGRGGIPVRLPRRHPSENRRAGSRIAADIRRVRRAMATRGVDGDQRPTARYTAVCRNHRSGPGRSPGRWS